MGVDICAYDESHVEIDSIRFTYSGLQRARLKLIQATIAFLQETKDNKTKRKPIPTSIFEENKSESSSSTKKQKLDDGTSSNVVQKNSEVMKSETNGSNSFTITRCAFFH
jgi:hypothetical protein